MLVKGATGWQWNIVPWRYNSVNFLQNSHKRCSIARPLGRGMEWLLWVQTLINIPPQSQQWCMHYHVILNRAITASDCIMIQCNLLFHNVFKKDKQAKSMIQLYGHLIFLWVPVTIRWKWSTCIKGPEIVTRVTHSTVDLWNNSEINDWVGIRVTQVCALQ